MQGLHCCSFCPRLYGGPGGGRPARPRLELERPFQGSMTCPRKSMATDGSWSKATVPADVEDRLDSVPRHGARDGCHFATASRALRLKHTTHDIRELAAPHETGRRMRAARMPHVPGTNSE